MTKYIEALERIVQAARSEEVDFTGQHHCTVCSWVEKYGHADGCVVKIAEDALEKEKGER